MSKNQISPAMQQKLSSIISNYGEGTSRKLVEYWSAAFLASPEFSDLEHSEKARFVLFTRDLENLFEKEQELSEAGA